MAIFPGPNAGVLVLLLLVAGCAGAPESAPPLSEPQSNVPLLSGVILDPAIAPISDAIVSVLGTNATATTGDDGVYRFDEVPVEVPIIVIAEATGYVSLSKSVTIPDASYMVLNFTLAAIPIKTPYFEYFPLEGFLSCQAAIVTPLQKPSADCSLGLDSNNKPLLDFNVNVDTAGIVLELEWQGRSAGPTTLNMTAETVNFGDADKVVAHAIGESVLRTQVPESIARQYYSGGGTLRVRIAAGAEPAAQEANVGASTPFQQDFTLHVSVFYVNPPNPSYSALVGA